MGQTNDIYAKAASELASIDEQIASLEQRRAALRQFVELGQRLYAQEPSATLPLVGRGYDANDGKVTLRLGPISRQILEDHKRESLKARVLHLSRDAIRMHGPLHTPRLVEMIEAAGVEVTGKDKNITVSVILSRSDDFVADRSRGWSLAEKNPQDAATSAGSSTA